MKIAVDFDGTCVTNDFPEIGKPIGAIKVLKRLIANGHDLILNTVRCDDFEGNGEMYLQEAVNYLELYGVKLYGVNKNPDQEEFSDSPKVFADLYIDDLSANIPVIKPTDKNSISDKKYVDWQKLEQFLISEKIIKK